MSIARFKPGVKRRVYSRTGPGSFSGRGGPVTVSIILLYFSPMESWLAELESIVGSQDLILCAGRLADYAGDEFPAAALRQAPRAAVRPKNAQTISEILKLANRHRVPVTAR